MITVFHTKCFLRQQVPGLQPLKISRRRWIPLNSSHPQMIYLIIIKFIDKNQTEKKLDESTNTTTKFSINTSLNIDCIVWLATSLESNGSVRAPVTLRHFFKRSAKAKFRPFFVLVFVLFFIFHEKSVIYKARGVKSAGAPFSIQFKINHTDMNELICN